MPVCRSQIANADCSTLRRGGLQGRGQGLQIPDCKCRLQHSTESGAARQGTGSANPRLQMQIAALYGEGGCRDRMRCEKKTQNTDFVCRLQHFSLQMRSVRCHHSLTRLNEFSLGGAYILAQTIVLYCKDTGRADQPFQTTVFVTTQLRRGCCCRFKVPFGIPLASLLSQTTRFSRTI